MTEYRYYKPKPRAGRSERMILRVSVAGEMATQDSAYGVGIDWEPAPRARLEDWDEITPAEALDLLYSWQMAEWNRLDATYKSVVAQPQRLSE